MAAALATANVSLCPCAVVPDSVAANVCFSSPPFAPNARAVKPEPVPVPTTVRPRRSGRLNVVLPSPVPNDVEQSAYSALYVVRDTGEPSHSSHFELGAAVPAYG